jgi:hypothetical protein
MKEKLLQKGIVLPEGFSAGFACEVVNPIPGTGLAGWANIYTRLSDEIKDDLRLNCTVLSDGEGVVVLYTVDALYVRDTMLDRVCEYLEKEYGLPAENVIMNATHTHSGPAIHYPDAPGVEEYLSRFYPALERITQQALQDLAPAKIFTTRLYTQGLNYVRRYVTLDGKKYLGNWGAPIDPEEGRHETQADNEMQLVRFVREEKKDIILCNWQCHPCTGTVGKENGTVVSPDWPGPFRDAVEEKLGVHCSFHQGCAGNLVSTTRIAGERSNGMYRLKGYEMALLVRQAFRGATCEIQPGKIVAERKNLTFSRSPDWMERNKTKIAQERLYVNVVSMGDLAFATAPCEWHDTCGQYVKFNSPFEMTFVCAYSNGVVSYIPSAYCWKVGGYEVKMCHFEPGTGETIAEELVSMLKEQKKRG